MGWGTSYGAGEGKRLSLIQMVLVTHLKAGFEKSGLTAVVIVMVTGSRYLSLRQGAPSSFSFQRMRNESSLCLLVA